MAIIAVAVAFLVVGAPGARAAGGSAESELAADTNNARAGAGLPNYAYAGDLASVALGQAQRMANDGQIYHNPNLGTEVANWRNVAENVGAGPDVNSVQQALMASSSHRANILSSTYTELGIGTATGGDGRLYVAEVFRLPDSQPDAAPEPAPEAAPEPASDPAPADAAPAAPPAPVTPPAPPTTVAPPAPVPTAVPVAVPVAARTTLRPTTPTTELRPRLAASVTRLPVLPRRTNPLVLWVAAFLAQLVLVAHMVTFWRRYRMGSGS